MKKTSKQLASRLYFLDWLRIIAIICVFLIHVGKIFDFHPAVVSNPTKNLSISAFRDFILVWVMPLFFIISGAGIALSKKTIDSKEFIKSKFYRLLVPLLFVGSFLVNAIYVYVERLSENKTVLNFFNWYPQYFKGIYGLNGNFALLGNGTYLWYLQFLFLFILILWPTFKKEHNILYKISKLIQQPITLLLLFVPISLSSIFFEVIGLGGMRAMGGWDLLSYFFFFVYGYMLFCNPNIRKMIYKHTPIILVITILLSIIYVDSHFGIRLNIPGITRHDLTNNGSLRPLNKSAWLIVLAIKGLLSWFWILSILGLSRRFLNFNNKFLKYANEAVLPFYILHHAVIYVVAYQFIKLNTSISMKFVTISMISFFIVIFIYELIIKRINIARFLFGMKKLPTNNKKID